MNAETQDKRARLLELRRKYADSLPSRLASMDALWASAQMGDRSALERLFRAAHAVAGSSGTFGLQVLGARARELEEKLSRYLDGTALDADGVASISRALTQLREPGVRRPEIDLPEPSPTVLAPTNREAPHPELVYIVEDDEALAEEFARHVETFGYVARAYTTAAAATEAARIESPAAAIIDVVLPEGDLAGPQLAQEIQFFSTAAIPVVFVSARTDWAARLAAARAGCSAYLTKPIDIGELLEQLDVMLHRRPEDSYRVLVVEDEQVLAAHYAGVLGDVGMQVEILTDPSRLLEAISDFAPELILMDLYMPGCTGLEAARVLRQKQEYLSIPIVFLSAESSAVRQTSAMQTGADDFLQKPIPNDRLVNAVAIRASRFRKLRTLMMCDGLTGLLNHVALKLRLETEIARARRQGSPLSVAMLDIDHFKSVNDRYGHPAGDRVIRTLSRLMSARLRKSDVIGRYGGEEFAVLLPDTTVGDAESVINTLREEFSQLAFRRDGERFSCTFSAGLALAPQEDDPSIVLRAADDALYRAKNGGRNRVCLA